MNTFNERNFRAFCVKMSIFFKGLFTQFIYCLLIPFIYREDYLTSQIFRTAEEKDNYYAELKTAAESGWDFSSRWFILDGTNKGKCYFSDNFL